jgi:hypothetical protein
MVVDREAGIRHVRVAARADGGRDDEPARERVEPAEVQRHLPYAPSAVISIHMHACVCVCM